MPVNVVRKLDSIQLGTGGTVLNGFVNAELSAEMNQLIEYAAGQAHPTFVGVREIRPMVRFTANQLGTLLVTEAVALGGKAYNNVGLFMAAASDTGVGKASRSGSHYRYFMSQALVYWESIRLSHNGTGTVNGMIAAVFDGTNIPVAYSGATSLPSASLPAEYFGAGPCFLGATEIDGIQDITISSGYRLLVEGAASEVYPTFCGIEQSQPEITIRTLEPVSVTTLTGLEGKPLVVGDGGFRAFGVKYTSDSTGGLARVAANQTVHLKAAIDYGHVVPMNVQGEGSRAVSDTFKVTGRANALDSTGSNPLSLTLAAIA